MSDSLHEKWEDLRARLRQTRRVLVAFSGGTDSALVAAAARQVLGRPNVLAVTAVSASLASGERQRAAQTAQALDIPHRFIQTNEIANPQYVANPSNRCFFCKTELYSRLSPVAAEEKRVLVDGFNASDRYDYRPGVQAASQWSVQHPLHDADLFKREIRILSRWLGLPIWNKPASPCLSSRIPYGTPVEESTLRRIDRAEALLHRHGFRTVRVRHYGTRARIEVPLTDLPRLLEEKCRTQIKSALKVIGYDSIEFDPRGFRSGRLNESLVLAENLET